jgi:hypothetical protein
MAIAYQSHTTNTASTTNQIVLTKPSGLAVGDLMVAHIVHRSSTSGGSRTVDTPAGWTVIGSEINVPDVNDYRIKIMYKLAEASDVAASDFTFTISGGNFLQCAGGLWRIDGVNPNTTIDAFDSDTAGATNSPSYSGGVDPTYADSFLLFLTMTTATGSNPVASTSDYTLVTSNPSWTERYDLTNIVSSPLNMSGAHAIRAQRTATGEYSSTITWGGTVVGSAAFLIVVRPLVSVTVTQVADEIAITGGTQVIKLGAKIVQAAANLVMTGGIQVIKRMASWVNTDKSSTTWTNQDKTQQ